MEKIRIMHIGDIHYPERHNAHLADIKDKGVSRDFIDKITPNKFDKVAKSLLHVIKTQEIHSVLLSGDLTSYGEKNGYQRCVEYFLDLFSKENCDKEIDLHVVPGNHDLERDKAGSANQFEKFKEFSSIWKANGKDILKPDGVRTSEIDLDGKRIKRLSLNTCVGCGEMRAFPPSIRGEIESLISSADLKTKPDFDIYGEQLDTPAANEEHISIVEDTVKNSSIENYLTLVLGHHGLLPQSTVRVDIYTEMINGGYIRSLLNTADFPVIYCHGHIHDDPVEVLSQPNHQKSNLVSISAPEFCDGFNLIEISFSSNNTPIGCSVIPYRVTTFTAVKPGEEIRIPLQKSQLVDEYCSNNVEEIYRAIPTEPDFFENIYKSISEIDTEISKENLAGILIELEWVGVISLDNRQKKSKKWIIRRIGL